MTNRYRSSCCCGTTSDPERPFDCSLGWGSPPEQAFHPNKDRSDRGYSNPGIYDNAMGQNPWDNWGFCSHTRDQELIVSIERDVKLDDRTEGAYSIGIECAFPCQCGNRCDSSYCRQVSNTGVPAYGYYSVSTENGKKPIFARYKRPTKIGDTESVNLRGLEVEWVGQTERPYSWHYNRVGIIWNEQDRELNGLNSNTFAYPLAINPNAEDDAGPRDADHPHGTLSPAHCTRRAGTGYCSDCVCSFTQNSCYYTNPYYCNYDHFGVGIPFTLPLTDSQAQLIGSDWDTNEFGYVPTKGYVDGKRSRLSDNACDQCPGESCPYLNRVAEYGGTHFWLQGISDHDTNPKYALENENLRKYRLFYYNETQQDLVQIYKSNIPCTSAEALWELPQTLFTIFRRETVWDLYWSGHSKKGFENLGINHQIPGVTVEAQDPNGNPVGSYNDYFISDEAGLISERRLPPRIGFACAGIPVFIWEIAYLYFNPDAADSLHAEQAGGTNRNWGYGSDSTWVGDLIQDYIIPPETLNNMLSAAGLAGDIFAITAIRSVQYSSGTNEQIARQHRVIMSICMTRNWDMPTQITDLWEDVGILPPPRNYGKEQEYKIFKKQLIYHDISDDSEESEIAACCVNIGNVIAGNASIPVGSYESSTTNDIYNSQTRMGLAGPNAPWVWEMRRLNGETNEFGDPLPEIPPDGFYYADPICTQIENFCSPTGCIDPECNDFVCVDQFQDQCCEWDPEDPNNYGWNSKCVSVASDQSGSCINNVTCINLPIDQCINYVGGIPTPGMSCPNENANVFDVENANFCEDNVTEGRCCVSCNTFGGGGGESPEILGCELTEDDGCEDYASQFEDDCGVAGAAGDWLRYSQCGRNNQACDPSYDGVFDWEAEPIPDVSCDLGEPTIEDFYFYGAAGGWFAWSWLKWTGVTDWQTFADEDRGGAFGGFNAAPFPILIKSTREEPAERDGFRQDCCACCAGACDPDCDASCNPLEDNCNWCSDALHVACAGQDRIERPREYVIGDLDSIYDYPDDVIDDQNSAGSSFVAAFPIDCANQSATITCRGIWWQFQKYDYQMRNPSDLDGGASQWIGCDTVNNGFWLVQDPYDPGEEFALGITVDANGITSAMVDSEIGKEIEVFRGRVNKFNISQLLSDETYEEFKGFWSGAEDYFFPDCGPNGATGDFVSKGFRIILRGDSPENDPPDIENISTQYLYNRRTRFYFDEDNPEDENYIFNPFEQLDNVPETKSDDEAWWQLVENYQVVINCQGDIGDPDDPNDDIEPYQLIETRTYPVREVYGKVKMKDLPDLEYESYGCNENRLRYTGPAARITEYQWYHPPYVKVTGKPARGQAQPLCNYTLPYSTLPWGYCCNTIPGNLEEGGAVDRYLTGAAIGPSPVWVKFNDETFPTPPGIIVPRS